MIRQTFTTPNGFVAQDVPLADGPWVAPLLDTDRVTGFLQDHARTREVDVTSCLAKHVRYRPGLACVVLYEVGLARHGSTRAVRVYGKVMAPGRGLPAVPRVADEASNPPALLPSGSVTAEADRTVFYEFPVDPFLPALVRADDSRGLARDILAGAGLDVPSVEELRVVTTSLRYKPEHRYILRMQIALDREPENWLWDGLVRFEHGVDHEKRRRLVKTLQSHFRNSDDLRVPDAELFLPEVGCSINPWKPGEDLSRKIRKGRVEVARRAGRTLAGIHRLSIPELPCVEKEQVRGILENQIGTFGNHPPAPGLAGTFRQALDALVFPTSESPTCLVHGDFHQGQLLAREETTCVLDWDRAHQGDPMEDYGRFEAQIHLLELRGKVVAAPLLEAFAEGYREKGGTSEAGHRSFWTGLTLVDLALREVRRQRSGWHLSSLAILDRARLVARGGAA